jgi:hypothetical protein
MNTIELAHFDVVRQKYAELRVLEIERLEHCVRNATNAARIERW